MPGAAPRFITTAQPSHWIASRMDDADVYNSRDEKIGDVEDIIVTESGQVEAIVISVGGFLGLGERYVAVPMNAVRVTRDNDSVRVMLDMTREQLREAPEFRYPNRR
jgi:sporulation protein YlmC with PRC-barrel domain